MAQLGDQRFLETCVHFPWRVETLVEASSHPMKIKHDKYELLSRRYFAWQVSHKEQSDSCSAAAASTIKGAGLHQWFSLLRIVGSAQPRMIGLVRQLESDLSWLISLFGRSHQTVQVNLDDQCCRNNIYCAVGLLHSNLPPITEPWLRPTRDEVKINELTLSSLLPLPASGFVLHSYIEVITCWGCCCPELRITEAARKVFKTWRWLKPLISVLLHCLDWHITAVSFVLLPAIRRKPHDSEFLCFLIGTPQQTLVAKEVHFYFHDLNKLLRFLPFVSKILEKCLANHTITSQTMATISD